MKFHSHTLATALLITSSVAFVPSQTSVTKQYASTSASVAVSNGDNNKSTSQTILMASFLDKLPNPFETRQDTMVPRPPSSPPPITNEPEALFSRTRAILASDLGLTDASFLADNFEWIGPNVSSSGALNKEAYLAAGKFFNIRGAFPDLDYRAHDFRLDPKDPLTVRVTARTVGTMRGELRLRGETLPPNGVRMICPPEAISITFDKDSGKVTKLCSGFTMDRLVGNTGGLCGVMAAATVAGKPPSEWEVYPPGAVISRFFGRSVQQLKEPEKVFLAPFPETVMIQLTKGVLSSELGVNDPDLLSDEYTFCGPFVGPIKKDEFIKAFSSFQIKEGLPDLDENYSNFRVDPYDPYRVWFDSKATGTRLGPLNGQEANGAKYIGPPEVGSMTFDDDGFCIRLTAGAVMDPTDCNTGGLGGAFGILYATGMPLPDLVSRPLPQILSRVQKSIISPFTGESVDDFTKPKSKVTEIKKSVAPPVVQKTIQPLPPTPPPVKQEKPKDVAVSKPKAAPKLAIKAPSIPKLPIKKASSEKAPVKKVTKPVAKKEPVKKSDDAVLKQKAALRAAEEERKKQAAQNKLDDERKKKEAAQAALEAKKREFEEKKAAAEAKRQALEDKKAAATAANELKKKELEEKKAAALAASNAQKTISKAKKGATISLGFFNFGSKKVDESSSSPAKDAPKVAAKAPRGVPTLSKWYQNKDGSVTGLIAGSSAFTNGESITTSPLSTKDPQSESLVVTGSGSKYFLDDKPSSAPWFSFSKPKLAEPASPAKPTSSAAEMAAEKRKKAAEEKKMLAEAKKAEFEAAKQARQEAAEQKKAELEAKKIEATQKREAILAAQKEKAKALASKPKKTPAPPAKKVDKKAAGLLANKKSGTISMQPLNTKQSQGIFGRGGKVKDTNAPRGVPVINKFKSNRDGSVSGFITGSNNFKKGERVTTSKLAPNQKVEAGNVVTTVSGSKYFLQ